MRVYTDVGKKDQGKFALQVALKTLPFYTKYVLSTWLLHGVQVDASQLISFYSHFCQLDNNSTCVFLQQRPTVSIV